MKTVNENKGVKALLAVLSIPLIIASVFLWWWVLTVLWGWFVVPLGAPQISLAHAAGLALIVNALTFGKASTEEVRKLLNPEEENSSLNRIGRNLAKSFARSVTALILGFLLVKLMGV